MPRRVLAFAWALLLGLLLPTTAWASWIENHVIGDEVRIEIDRDGKAVVEHKLTIKTNGSRRQHHFELVGVDADATFIGDSYVIPGRDALSGSIQNAIPLKLKLKEADEKDDGPRVLAIEVDDRRGLWRGPYLFVIRYATDMRTRGRIRRDGAMLQVGWTGPSFPDGFDGARVTFQLPHAPTPPRAVGAMSEEESNSADDDAPAASTFLSEVHPGNDFDEIELLRTYARVGDPITWAIRVDPRALAPLPAAAKAPDGPEGEELPAEVAEQPTLQLPPDRVLGGVAAALGLLLTLVVAGKHRETARMAGATRAIVRPLMPLPWWLRAPLAGLAFVGGLALQLVIDRPVLGAVAVAIAAWAAAMAGPRVDGKAAMRGPGTWLTLTEREGLGDVPRPSGAIVDISTRAGKGLLALLLTATGVAAGWLGRQSLVHGLMVGASSIVWIAPFCTGGLRAMPPDLAVEPVRFLRRVAGRLRKRKDLEGVRVVPRVRIPREEVDPDEVRLLIAPRTARRGFTSIEIGVTYALGFASRVPMPEVLLRVQDGSPCHEDLAPLLVKGRSSPGRHPDERVIAFSPRLPTVRMTVEIAAALVARVKEEAKPEPKDEAKRRRRRRPKAEALPETEEAAA